MTTNTSTEVKTDNVSVAVTQKPGSHVTLELTVNPEAVKAARAKAIKAVNKEISIPGFRKGKAPDDYIIKNYPKQVDSEMREIVLQTAIQEILPKLKQRPYLRDGIKCTAIKEMSLEKGAQFTIEFEAAPQVPPVNLMKITLKNADRPPVTEHEVNRIIEDLRYRFAKWEDITDRPAQEDDIVDLQIEKMDEPRETICKDARFSVKEMSPWMKKLVIGLRPNETAEGTSERDKLKTVSEEDEEEQPFQPTLCQITLKAIKKPILPELNDQFAQKLHLKDVADLQERIVADLNRNADEKVREQLHQQIDQYLLEHYYFDLPLTLLQSETKQRMEENINWLKQNGADEEVLSKRTKELQQNLPAQVERSCRLFFLFMAISHEHNISVSREEVAAELSSQILQGRRLPNDKNSVEVQNRLTQQLLLRKTRDYIIDHVKRT